MTRANLKRLSFFPPALLISGARSYCEKQDICVDLSRRRVTKMEVENYKKQHSPKLWNTSAHNDLIQLLIYQSRSLVSGRFVGKNGIQSNLIQGPKGIGKSTVLESVSVMKSIMPNLIPVYITYSDLNASRSEVTEKSVLEIVLKRLPEAVRSKVSDEGILGRSISVALESENQFVFLIVDEIDQLYRVDSRMTPELGKVAYRSIGDLAWLGDQKLGRFAIFICGSSANCPLLVTGEANRDDYPLVRGSPSLNYQKYQTHRLPVPIFTNIAGVKDVLTALGHNASDEYARFVAFSVGAVPRALDEFVKKANTADPLYTTLRYKDHESALPQMDKSILRALEVSLMTEFKKLNGEVLLKISSKEGQILPHLIAEEHWENHVVGLSTRDIVRVWQVMRGEQFAEQNDFIELQRLLFVLCDRGVFTFDGITDGLPQTLYPICPAQVFVDMLEPDALTTFAKTYDKMALKFLQDFADNVSLEVARGVGVAIAENSLG